MVQYKLQPMKSETCYRLIPTIMFIIAITSIVLTIFFMLVLQSRNAHTLDGEYVNIDNDDFQMEIVGATSDQIANLDLDNINLEDGTKNFITTQPPPLETFLLKKTINPSTNNHIKTIDSNLRSMKAYKIVSKEPIIENSLVKIVMAPQNILEKLSKQDRNSVKYVADKIDESGNVPIKNYNMDDIFERELIQNGNGNVKVEVFSLEEDDGNVSFMENIQPKKNVIESNNIQVIAKSQPLNTISIEQRNPFDLKGNVGDAKNIRDEVEAVNDLQSIDVDMESKEIVSEVDSSNMKMTTTTEAIIDSTYTEAEELLSNPTTSQNLLQEEMQPEFEEEDKVSTVINSSSDPFHFQDSDSSPMASSEVSTEGNVPLVLLKILKNRTALIEETDPESTSDQLGMTTTSIPTLVFPKIFNRPSTTTKAHVINDVKLFQFPKKPKLMDPQRKYKNPVPKFEDMFIKMTPQTRLLDVETHVRPQSEFTAKSKYIKRAIGDEGKFSNIVRPSPIRQKNIGNFLPRESEAQRAERLSKSMKHLMNLVTIVGHVDSYLTKRFRHGLKNVVKLLDSVEETRRRRSNF